jgi:hypothetical protein
MNKENTRVKSVLLEKNQSFLSYLNRKNQLNNSQMSISRGSLNLPNLSLKKSGKKKKKVTFEGLKQFNLETKDKMRTIQESFNLSKKSESRISLKDILFNENNLIQLNLPSSPRGIVTFFMLNILIL